MNILTRLSDQMHKQKSTTKIIIAVFLLFCVASGSLGVWLFQSWQEAKQAALDAAYQEFLPEASPAISNRYHDQQGFLTDTVERFRFDGADEKLVKELVQRYELKPAQEPAESDFKAPSWWVLPEGGACYLRGEGHQYFMLVYQPDASRVFFEHTQD